MSTNLAPPPAPPPPPPAPSLPAGGPNNWSASTNLQNFFERCTQSTEDVQKEVRNNLNNVLELPENEGKFAICSFSSVQPMVQRGPVCGLVALGMALDHYAQTETSLEDVFEQAKNVGMTKSGEMFSAKKLKQLTEWSTSNLNLATNCCPELVDTEVPESTTKILSCLMNNDLVLIPYDADYNHAPAKRNGIAAHWAVIIGFAVILPQNSDSTTFQITEPTITETTLDDRIAFTDTLTSEQKSLILELVNSHPSSIYVICRQGKSKHIGLWVFPGLLESNQNLKDIGDKIRQNPDEYVLESIDITLKSQAILLWRKSK